MLQQADEGYKNFPCATTRMTSFVVSTDGLLGKEAKILLKKLSAMLAEKWEKPYSEVCGYVNARMSIAIVRATHLCLRGSYSDEQNVQPPPAGQSRPGLFCH